MKDKLNQLLLQVSSPVFLKFVTHSEFQDDDEESSADDDSPLRSMEADSNSVFMQEFFSNV